MFNKRIIQENQRGFLFKNGKFIKMLTPGKYYEFGDREIVIAFVDQPLALARCSVETVLGDKAVAAATTVIEVGDEEMALHFVNGKFENILRTGKHVFWTVEDTHEFKLVDTSTPEVSADVPTYIFAKIPSIYYHKVEVAEYQKARL